MAFGDHFVIYPLHVYINRRLQAAAYIQHIIFMSFKAKPLEFYSSRIPFVHLYTTIGVTSLMCSSIFFPVVCSMTEPSEIKTKATRKVLGGHRPPACRHIKRLKTYKKKPHLESTESFYIILLIKSQTDRQISHSLFGRGNYYPFKPVTLLRQSIINFK